MELYWYIYTSVSGLVRLFACTCTHDVHGLACTVALVYVCTSVLRVTLRIQYKHQKVALQLSRSIFATFFELRPSAEK